MKYPLIARVLHWVIALHIIGLLALGWYMVGLTYYDRWYNTSLSLHRSFGMLALLLGLAFTFWKLTFGRRSSKTALKSWERRASRVMHGYLFLMLLLIPVTGYLISTSAGSAFSVFGVLAIEPVIDVNETLRDTAVMLHFYAAYITAIMVLLHALAALRHHFLNKDDTLRRML